MRLAIAAYWFLGEHAVALCSAAWRVAAVDPVRPRLRRARARARPLGLSFVAAGSGLPLGAGHAAGFGGPLSRGWGAYRPWVFLGKPAAPAAGVSRGVDARHDCQVVTHDAWWQSADLLLRLEHAAAFGGWQVCRASEPATMRLEI
jgi:hypothetical protein